MRIISFAWTAPAFQSFNKSVTRRQWADRYAESFKEGELLQAWDKVPYAGGHRIGTIRLTKAPYKQAWRDMPDSAYEDEGFCYLHDLCMARGVRSISLLRIPLTWDEFERWRDRDGEAWVVEFSIVGVVGGKDG